MGRFIGELQQQGTGLTVRTYEGFSWPCFFCGCFWYMAKGMWGRGFVWFVVSLISGSALHWLGILIVPFFANAQYRDHLGARGYKRTGS
jgi:hypothetical protein